MKNNKLTVLLATLSGEEIKAFGKHIKALYGNYDVAICLFEYFRKWHPNLADEKKLNKEKVIQKVLGSGTEFAEKRILNESSRLYKWLEEFLLLEKLRQKNNARRDIMMAEILKERQLSHPFYLHLDRIIQAYEQEQPKDLWSIFDRLYLQHLRYYYSDPQESLHTKDQAVIQSLMKQTDAFYLATKLQYGAELFSRMNVVQESYEPILFWDDIRQMVHRPTENAPQPEQLSAAVFPHCSTPLHQALLLTATLMEKKDLASFKALEHFFKINYPLFSPETQYILHGSLINFASGQLKGNDYQWADLLFDLYEFEMNAKILFENGLVSSMRFLNIVNLACHLGKLVWAERFTNKWKLSLRPNLSENTLQIAHSLILFHHGKYQEVLDILRNKKSIEPFLELRIRSLYIMASVEVGEEVTESCRNLRDYLTRNKTLSQSTIDGFGNFQRLLRKSLRPDTDKEALGEEINACKSIFNKSWLLKKLPSLKNGVGKDLS